MSNLEDFSEAVIKNEINKVQKTFKTEYLYQFNQNGFTGFLQACHLGHLELVKFFIRKDADIELTTSNGWNGLHWAAGSGHREVVEFLLDKGADKEAETNKKFRALHCAALGMCDYDQVVRVLLVRGCDVNARNKDNKTALDLATDMNNGKCISLLKKWIDYDRIFNIVRDQRLDDFVNAFLPERITVKEKNSGKTVVDVAVESESHSCLERIFLNDLDENVLVTALQYSLKRMKVSHDSFRAQYRLYRSIILDIKEKFDEFALIPIVNSPWYLTGQSFLEIAVHCNRKDMVVSILQMLLTPDQSLAKALVIATNKQLTKIVNILTQRRQLIESRERASFNRLYLAIQDNRHDVVKHILTNRLIDPNESSRVLGPPICFALSLGCGECVQLLLDHAVNVNVHNTYHQTPIHIAIDSGMVRSLPGIINKTNNVDQPDFLEYTPLHHAAINKDDEICRLLLNKGANLVNNLKISGQDSRLDAPILPLLNFKNPLTLCLKLHGVILPSLMAKIDIDYVNLVIEDGCTLLHLSARMLLSDLCTQLINKGANYNALNNAGNIPIHSVFLESFEDARNRDGYLATVRALVDGGSNINLLNNVGMSPFRCAFATGDRNLIASIISQCDGLDSTMEDFFHVYNNGWEDIFQRMLSLQKDEFHGHLVIECLKRNMNDFVDLILAACSDAARGSIIVECLNHSAHSDNEAMFQQLLNNQITQPKLFPSGQTLLTGLIIENNVKFSLMLAKSELGKKFIDCPNGAGQTPFYLSAQMESLKLCKCMIIESQTIEYTDADGETAMEKVFKSSSNTTDMDKLKDVEKIIKTMIKFGMDIYRVNKNDKRAITFCQDANLRSKLVDFAAKNVNQRPRNDEERNICDICFTNPIDCQFGCGHPMCTDCFNQVHICPSCRRPKHERIPLYL